MEVSVMSLFETYIFKTGLRESSIELKKRALGEFVRLFGDLPASSITREMAEDYRIWLVTDSRSRASANIYLKNLAPVFGWFAAKGYISSNPFAELPAYRAERKVRPIFTPDEIGRILRVADSRWRILVLLAARHSLRRGEALNICRGDIDGQWLHIRSKTKSATQWPWQIKNHAEALIKISEPLHKAIGDLLVEVPEAQPYIVVVPKLYRKMIHLQAENSLGWQYRNCPYSNFARAWRKLLDRANVHPRRYQDLRGSYATILRRAGMGIDEVQRLMRHSSISTTQDFYLRYDMRELADKSETILSQVYKT